MFLGITDLLTASTIDTIKCTTKTGIYAGLFPAATSEITYSIGGLKDAYINNASNELQVYGAVEMFNLFPVPVVFRPLAEELYKYTMTYELSWSGGYTYRVQIPDTTTGYDSLRVQSFVFYHDTVDSYGMCTTPYGTRSVLRIQIIQRSIDSVYRQSDTLPRPWRYIGRQQSADTSYNWISDSLGYPMLSMQVKKGKVTVASWLKKTNTGVGIDEITDKAGSLVYPNPASTELNIKLASCENGYVQVMDMTGRIVSTTQFSNKLANVSTSGFANGIYLYQVFDKTSNLVDRGKFSIAK